VTLERRYDDHALDTIPTVLNPKVFYSSDGSYKVIVSEFSPWHREHKLISISRQPLADAPPYIGVCKTILEMLGYPDAEEFDISELGGFGLPGVRRYLAKSL